MGKQIILLRFGEAWKLRVPMLVTDAGIMSSVKLGMSLKQELPNVLRVGGNVSSDNVPP